jgi:Ca2+-binding EF-hand superfamily protein
MRLKSYKGETFFKRAAMNILVKMSSEDQLKNLSAKFKEMDLDGTGMISMSEIKKFI